MVAYKLKVIHVEDYTLNYIPISQNGSAYSRIENNYGNDSKTVLLYDRYLCGTGTPKKLSVRSNIITTSIYLVLLSLHIVGTKYRMQSSKRDTATSIKIHKRTEIIESNKILEVTDDK